MISNPTIVTSLFNIGRDKWETYNVSYHTYLWWMKNTLSIDANFVVYTDEYLYNKILEIRREFDPNMVKTKIIKCNLESLSSYKMFYERMKELMQTPEFITKIVHHVPEMTRPLYNIVIFNKLGFLKNAETKKYFDGDFYIWVDAGGLRDELSKFYQAKWPNIGKLNNIIPNDKVTFFSHREDFNIDNEEFHAMSQIRYIQGGSLFCPPQCIEPLLIKFNKTVNYCLNSGFIGSEEKILDINYNKNKSLYNLIKCDWREYFDIFV